MGGSKLCLSGYIVSSRVVGYGSFAGSEVRIGVCRGSGDEVAIKILDKAKLTSSQRERVEREARVLRDLSHAGVVVLHDRIETATHIFLVMELLCGDLYEFLLESSPSEDEVRDIFTQIARAMAYVHSEHIVHHDLKLENVMLVQPGRDGPAEDGSGGVKVKIIDFNLCNDYCPTSPMEEFCGTQAYSAPEVLEGEPYDGLGVDAYAAGVMLYILLTKRYPFTDELFAQYQEQTSEKYLKEELYFPVGVSRAAMDLVIRLLEPEPALRLSFKAALEHPWIEAVLEVPPTCHGSTKATDCGARAVEPCTVTEVKSEVADHDRPSAPISEEYLVDEVTEDQPHKLEDGRPHSH